MTRNAGRIASVAMAAVLATAAMSPALAETTGTLSVESPGRTLLVYWHAGNSTLSFYDVEARKTSNLDVKFFPNSLVFTPGGRYLCVQDGLMSGQLVVLDVVRKRTIIRLIGTADSNYYCKSLGLAFADPSQPIDALAANVVPIQHIVTAGPPACGRLWTTEKVTDFFLDPRFKKPKVVQEFTRTTTAC